MKVEYSNKKKFLARDPAIRGKKVYILYKFDIENENLVSDGPYLNKDEAYKKMNRFFG